MNMKRTLSLTLLLCTPVLLPLGQPPLLAQPAPGAVTPAASPHPDVLALRKQGDAAQSASKPEEAQRLFEQAVARARALKDRAGEADALYSIGLFYASMGQWQKVLESHNQAWPLYREIGNKMGEAATLSSVGALYDSFGQPQKTLESYNRALRLFREAGNKRNEANALNSMGSVYADIGQPQKALEFHNQALPLHRETGNKQGEANTLTNIGWVYREIGQPQKALEFLNQALSLTREGGDKWHEAHALGSIGGVYYNIGQPQKALGFYNQALLLARETGDKWGVVAALAIIGRVYADIGQPQKALEFLNRALPLYKEAGSKASVARVLSHIGAVEELQGQLPQAGNRLRAALSIYEEIRETLAASSENKVGFLQKHLPVYHRYINLLLKQRSPASAFEWTQKTKARALLDLLSSGKVDISKGTSAQEQERERELKGRIGQFNRRLLNEAVGTSPDKKARIKALKAQVAQAQRELSAFTDALYAKYPALARKRAARTVSLQEVARFLPPDTALLEYVTLQARGSNKNKLDKTVLFCVTTKNGKASVRAYPISRTRAQLTKLADDFRAACTNPKKDYRHQARALYALLMAPADKQLAGKKRLIVCPDGPLWGLPFQALMTPGVKGQPSGSRFLIEQHELDYAYSATGAQAALLAGQSISNKNSTSIKGGNGSGPRSTGTLLALANPEFGGPSRLEQPGATAGSRPLTAGSRALTASSRFLTVDLRAVGTDIMGRNGAIAPLPGTQLEANAIKADFPSALIRTGAKAQESIAKAEAPRHRFLHFATHGFFNDASPLDSAIVLAQPPTNGAGSEDDGLLTAREIFDLNWPADLVVLSACNTARGGQSAGEGVVGLSWALFVAGAPSQVLSQWAVADASTAQLMQGLYSNLKAGRPKGEALREASLGLMKDGKHGHPFYWAPFVLIGDWR